MRLPQLDPTQLAFDLPDWWCVMMPQQGAAVRGRPAKGLLVRACSPRWLPAVPVPGIGTA